MKQGLKERSWPTQWGEQMGSSSVREWKESLLFRYSRGIVVCDDGFEGS